MKKILNIIKKYKLILFALIGVLLGLFFKDFSINIKPIGNLILNLILVIIVPLVIFSIISNILELKNGKKVKKILITSFLVFLVTLIFTGLFTILLKNILNFDYQNIKLSSEETVYESVNILEKMVGLLSVNDFSLLLSKSNILPLIIFSIIIGLCINQIPKNEKIVSFFSNGKLIIEEYVKKVMKIFPLCICIYIASLVGEFGTILLKEYVKFFIEYLIIGLLNILVLHTIYLYIAGKKNLIKIYYRNIFKLILTAVSTQSSVVTMPTNKMVIEKMGVSNEVNGIVTPIATLINMQGNVIQNLMKIFLVCNMFSIKFNLLNVVLFILCAILSGAVTAGIPGGGIVSNTITLTVLGLPMEALPILTTIEIILDAPATAFNILSDTSTLPLIDKLVKKC